MGTNDTIHSIIDGGLAMGWECAGPTEEGLRRGDGWWGERGWKVGVDCAAAAPPPATDLTPLSDSATLPLIPTRPFPIPVRSNGGIRVSSPLWAVRPPTPATAPSFPGFCFVASFQSYVPLFVGYGAMEVEIRRNKAPV